MAMRRRDFQGERSLPTEGDPDNEDIYIAVMGVTGAGKSTFISHCTEAEVPVGHNLESCTQQVNLFPVDYAPKRTVWLVDTPGFDDQSRNDTDVLKEIAAWFIESYKEDVKLHGIIYLHRIADTRMTGSGMRNLSMFRKLCGPDALEHVVLATTMWENVDRQKADKRENELRTKSEYWGDMITNGSTMLRHQNNQQSAMRLIDHFVKKPAEVATTVLDLQKEMVDDDLTLAMTGAGQSVDGGLLKQREQYEKTLTDLQQDLADARQSNNQKVTELLEKERQKTQAELNKLAQQREDLQITLENLMKEKMEKMEREHAAVIELMHKRREEDIRRERESNQVTLQHYQQRFEDEARLVNDVLGGRSPSREVLNWPVSMSIFGDRYWFDALYFDIGFPADPVPGDRTGKRWVSWGDEGSWFVRHRRPSKSGLFGSRLRDFSIFSDNFKTLYPGAYTFLNDEHLDEDPTCVSLCTNGHYFARSKSGCSYNLPESILEKLEGQPSEFEGIWLGEGETFVSQRQNAITNSDGTSNHQEFHLKGRYQGLEDGLKAAKARIKRLALNPMDGSEYAVLLEDGSAQFSQGLSNFKPDSFQSWCRFNFGTSWADPHQTTGTPMLNDPGIFAEFKGPRRWWAPWKRKTKLNASALASLRKSMKKTIIDFRH